MATQAQIDQLRADIASIEEEMMGEKSISVDGKITVSKRSTSELATILARKEQQLAEALGTVGAWGNANIGIRGGFGV